MYIYIYPSPPRTYYLGTKALEGPLRTYYLGTWGARHMESCRDTPLGTAHQPESAGRPASYSPAGPPSAGTRPLRPSAEPGASPDQITYGGRKGL